MKTEQTVYLFRGIMYVPHFSKKGMWVSPGYPRQQQVEFDTERLKKLGATKQMYPLFAKP